MILFNTSTSEHRVLANLRGRNHYLTSDQVNGDWATYDVLRLQAVAFSDCQVSLYQISTDTLTQLPNPNRQQYSSSVTSDGTVYFGREAQPQSLGLREGCSGCPSPQRWQRGSDRDDTGGSKTSSPPFAFEEADTSTTLLLGRNRCRRGPITREGNLSES